ncbi:hypothetical protein D3C81_1621820 [compost metagenome]
MNQHYCKAFFLHQAKMNFRLVCNYRHLCMLFLHWGFYHNHVVCIRVSLGNPHHRRAMLDDRDDFIPGTFDAAFNKIDYVIIQFRSSRLFGLESWVLPKI